MANRLLLEFANLFANSGDESLLLGRGSNFGEAQGNCLASARREITSIEQNPPGALTSQGYFEGADNLKEFTSAYSKAAKLARERVDRMTVASH